MGCERYQSASAPMLGCTTETPACAAAAAWAKLETRITCVFLPSASSFLAASIPSQVAGMRIRTLSPLTPRSS